MNFSESHRMEKVISFNKSCKKKNKLQKRGVTLWSLATHWKGISLKLSISKCKIRESMQEYEKHKEVGGYIWEIENTWERITENTLL